MLEYIRGVAEAVLTGEEDYRLTFSVHDGAIITDLSSNGKQAANTQRLHRAVTREHGRAVGENLLAAL